MTTSPNQEQSDAWNGESGRRWVTGADERDRVLAPVADALFTAAELTPGLRVLDVGCGCGATTLRAARLVGTTGTAIGIDLSAPMLEVARERAHAGTVGNTFFVHGDAQTHEFSGETIDLVIGRFGTMFFSDPVAAFANVRRALRPGGRLALATWRPLAANQWLTVPGAALLKHTAMPDQGSDGPGMFAQSDPGTVTAVLRDAGFVDVALDAVEVTFTLGPTIDAAVAYLSESGPGRALLETIPNGAARDAAIADVRAALVDHDDGTAVRLDGAIWIITAERPTS
jgi:SAM-dependent methyltransferase